MYRRIIVAYDGSENSKRALFEAIDLSAKLGAELLSISAEFSVTVPNSVPGFGPTEPDLPSLNSDSVAEELTGLAAEAKSTAALKGISLTPIGISGEDAVEAILDAISENKCDLLVIGLRQHVGLLDRMLNRTQEHLEERAPCSVLGVR